MSNDASLADSGGYVQFLELLMRSIRTGSLYSDGHPKRAEAIGRAHGALTEVFGHGLASLRLAVSPDGLSVNDTVLKTDEAQELARRISAGGLSSLELGCGVNASELDALSALIALDMEHLRLEDDLATLLWEREWKHVRWEAVEVPTAPVEEEPSTFNSTILSQDLPTEPLRPAETTPRDFLLTEEEQALIESEVAVYLADPSPTQIGGLLCQLIALEKRPEHFQNTLEMLRSVVDLALREGRFHAARETAGLLEQLRQDSKSMTDEKLRLIKECQLALASPAALDAIVPVLEEERWDDADQTTGYLAELPSNATDRLLELLLTLQSESARDLLRRAVAFHLRSGLSAVRERLAEFSLPGQFELVRLLREVGTKEAVPILKEMMQFGGPDFRLEILAALEQIGGAHARAIIVRSLADGAPEVRCRAVRALPVIGRREALEPLLREMLRAEFRERELEERKVFFQALGETDMPEVLPLMKRLLMQKSWWKKKAAEEDRECAAAGLLVMTHPDAIALREELVQSGPKAVREIFEAAHSEADAA